MNEFAFIQDLFFILSAAFIGGFLAKMFKLPLVVGYLTSGIIIGQLAAYLFPRQDTLTGVAQVGVALLLFTLGLEFTLQKLKDLGEVIIFGAFIEVILTTFIGSVLLPFLGFDFFTSLVLGVAFSLSSTAVAIKTLSDRGELETMTGELSAGWLFMQDFFTIPILLILPVVGQLLAHGSILDISSLFTLIRTLFYACVLFWLILLLGKTIVPKVMEKIAELNSRELVTIGGVSLCFLFALLFQVLGFSYTVGAFVAGILIASSSARLGIFSEVRPLRDLFSVVFFVSLGFLFDPSFLILHLGLILALVLFVMLIKFIISIGIIFLLGYHAKTAVLVSLSLLTVGEFAFIIALSLYSSQLITYEAYMTILTVTLISLLVGTLPLYGGSRMYYIIKNFITRILPVSKRFFNARDLPVSPAQPFENHVIVLGYGRVGKYICRALTFVDIPFIVVDFDHRTVKKIRGEGINAIYGDPADPMILTSASIKEARAVILAYADRMMQEVVVTTIVNLNPKVHLLCRVHFEEDQKKLKSLGVHTVIQPEFEAAIALTTKILKLCNIRASEIEGKITRLKIEHGLG